MRGFMGRVMKNLSLLLGLMALLVVMQEPVAHARQMQPFVAQPPLRADCTAVQVAFKICRAPAPVVGGKQPAATQSAGQSQKQPVLAFPAAPAAAAKRLPATRRARSSATAPPATSGDDADVDEAS